MGQCGQLRERVEYVGAFLRTAIAGCAGVMVWVLMRDSLGSEQSIATAIVPVWVAGLVGGVVSALFAPRQGITVAFRTGVMMALLFFGLSPRLPRYAAGWRHAAYPLADVVSSGLLSWRFWLPTVLQRVYRR